MNYLNNIKNNFDLNNNQNLINPVKEKFSNNDDISSINTKDNFNFNGNENDNGFNRNYVDEVTTNIIDDFPDYNNKKEELFKKYETMNTIEQNYKNNANYNMFNNNNKNKQNIPMPKNKTNQTSLNQLTKKNSKKNYNNENNNLNKYELEIIKLKQEIESLENNNEILSNQLKEEEKRNEELNIIKNEKEENDNSILSDISHCLQVNSFEEILPKLNEMINFLNQYNNDQNVKIKEELITKLKSLYISSNNSYDNKENITIQDLWRWIKNLINNVRQLSVEKKKNAELYNNNYAIYKKYCEKLIQEFNLNSFDELKIFIDDLLAKNNVNKKRVEKLRKVLMNNRDKKDFSPNALNQEKNENNINEGGYENMGQEMEGDDVDDIGNNNIDNKKFNKNDYYENNLNDYNLNYNYEDN